MAYERKYGYNIPFNLNVAHDELIKDEKKSIYVPLRPQWSHYEWNTLVQILHAHTTNITMLTFEVDYADDMLLRFIHTLGSDTVFANHITFLNFHEMDDVDNVPAKFKRSDLIQDTIDAFPNITKFRWVFRPRMDEANDFHLERIAAFTKLKSLFLIKYSPYKALTDMTSSELRVLERDMNAYAVGLTDVFENDLLPNLRDLMIYLQSYGFKRRDNMVKLAYAIKERELDMVYVGSGSDPDLDAIADNRRSQTETNKKNED